MSNTGYIQERAKEHNALVNEVWEELIRREFKATILPPNGDAPDISVILRSGERCFLDPKFMNGRNYAIKMGAFHRALACPVPTFFMAEDWTIHSAVSLLPRLLGGPNPPTGKGSNTYWYLFEREGGIAFNDFFPWQ